jgi:hypothetical protein
LSVSDRHLLKAAIPEVNVAFFGQPICLHRTAAYLSGSNQLPDQADRAPISVNWAKNLEGSVCLPENVKANKAADQPGKPNSS